VVASPAVGQNRGLTPPAGQPHESISGTERAGRYPFDVNVVTLPPTTASVPVARRFVRARLVEGLADVDTATLLVSEVVTNAILHAHTPVTLTVEVADEVVRVAVRDGSPAPPRINTFPPTAATGRGMLLLDRLAKRWGVDHDPGTGGKVVWFEVGEPAEAAWAAVSEGLLSEATGLSRLD
jgi:anti-sigma regulatory factor (Ser/Thr protein kinase)